MRVCDAGSVDAPGRRKLLRFALLFTAGAIFPAHGLLAEGRGQSASGVDANLGLVFGTTSTGTANFAIVKLHPGSPQFAGFSLKKDIKGRSVSPGRYILGGLFFNGSLTSYAIGGALYGNAEGAGMIEVAAGEAIYIGHMVFERKGNALTMRVEDRFEAVRKSLPPHISSKLQRRLIRLPPRLDYDPAVRNRF